MAPFWIQTLEAPQMCRDAWSNATRRDTQPDLSAIFIRIRSINALIIVSAFGKTVRSAAHCRDGRPAQRHQPCRPAA